MKKVLLIGVAALIVVVVAIRIRLRRKHRKEIAFKNAIFKCYNELKGSAKIQKLYDLTVRNGEGIALKYLSELIPGIELSASDNDFVTLLQQIYDADTKSSE